MHLNTRLLTLLWLVPATYLSAQQELGFKHLTMEEGLSSNSTLSIAQDKEGFLWVGTMDGLNRFDGKRIRIYRSFLSDNFRGTRRKINCLLAEGGQRLWVGTNNGLFLYNSKTDSFTACFHEPAISTSISNDAINSLYQDSHGAVWAATDDGLNKVVWTKDSLSFVRLGLNTKTSPSGKRIFSVFEARNGNLMVGTGGGLIRAALTPDRQQAVDVTQALPGMAIVSMEEDARYFWVGTQADGLVKLDQQCRILNQFRQGDDGRGLLSNVIRKIHLDREGRLWIGTLKGLNLLQIANDQVVAYRHNPANSQSLNFNSIYDLFEDRQGNMWIATFFGGLNCVEAAGTPFKIYQDANGDKGVSSNIISALVEDGKGNLWIGTEAEGLNYFDRKNQVFKTYKSEAGHPGTLSSNLVKAIVKDEYQHIWVALHDGGVNVLDEAGRKLAVFDVQKGSNSLNSRRVISLMRDHQGRIWMGHEAAGINIYNPASKRLENFDSVYPGKRLSSNGVSCLFEDAQQNIWIGTGQGLNKLAKNGSTLRYYFNHNRGETVHCIIQDARKRVWVGSYAGLFWYDPIGDSLVKYITPSGVGDFQALGIAADNGDNLWISTNNGLMLLDSARKHFYAFDVQDGLPGNVFNYRSCLRDSRGQLFFGGFKGLVAFDPRQMSLNQEPAQVVLTELRVNGKTVSPGDSTGILGSAITSIDEIVLRYDQNVLELDYAVMNFIKPGKNRSAYLLERYGKNWTYTASNSASFTNLPPGNYRLLIRAANNDGIWNDNHRVLRIKILPPPWKTWWAYTLYALFLGLLAFGIIYFFSSRTAMRRKLRYEHMLYEQQQELHQMKMDFFTHVSHELRTPLTLIAGPVEMLMQILPGNQQVQKLLATIRLNADRLIKLTNDLLAFRKAESGHTQLTIEEVDLVAFIGTIARKFEEEAAGKNIDFRFESSLPALTAWFDVHHMEIIVSNLLSNAFKFTPGGGRISISIEPPENAWVKINVCDNGAGIPAESQDKIFTGFYQADSSTKKHLGTGIGLAFSKKLVELHKGTLHFRSGKNAVSGKTETCFTVSLPLIKPSTSHRSHASPSV